MASIDPTLETLAPSKLLNYVQKERLVEFLSPTRYADLEQRLRQQLNKSSINLKDMKKQLATRPEFMQSLRQHAIGKEAFGKYQQAAQRLSNIDRTKSSASRKVMTQPRNRYQGCLASRLKPADYDHCLDNYNSEEFDNIELVPPALKQRVYDQGDVATRGILKETLTRKTGTLSDLPKGYRAYISKNPDQFKDYFEQKRHELGLLRSVLKNLSSEDKRKLQAYYQQHKTIEPEKFSDIIASFQQEEDSPSKRPRPTTGGKKSRFDLEDRIYNQDSFLDGSDTDVLDFN
jgi:hypothetical protein